MSALSNIISPIARTAAESAIRAARSLDTERFERTFTLVDQKHHRAVWNHCRANEPHLTLVTAKPGVGRWGLANWQRRVLEDPAGRILIRGGNKIGKSLELAEECALFLDGKHPTRKRPTDRPARILYVVADMQNAYASDVCRTLRECIPSDRLDPRTKYDAIKGYTVSGARALLWADGSEIMFRSGTQDGQAIAGLWADLVIINEPPMITRWGEIMRAAALHNAPVIVGFTPVDSHGASRDLLWLRDIVEGRPGEPTPQGPDGKPLWSQHVITLCPENVPHRKPRDVEQQIADMPPWEVAQRRDAAWEGPSLDRRISAFTTEHVFEHSPGQWDALPEAPDKSALRFGLAADHGERAAKEVIILYAWAFTGPELRCWILDAYVSPSATSIEQDAEAVCRMLARHVWKPAGTEPEDCYHCRDHRGYDSATGATPCKACHGQGKVLPKPAVMTPDYIDTAVGDTNSTGKGDMLTRTVNDAFTNAWRAMGYNLVMRPANKGHESVALGVHVLNDAFARNRIFVSQTARPIIHALSRWQGGNSEVHKDKVDPVRYGPAALFATVRDTSRQTMGAHTPVVDTTWMDGGAGGAWTGEGGY